jgi:hypothetical protein
MFQTTREAWLCRRRQQRQRIHAVSARCWSSSHAPVCVTVIEADVKGARLMLPFPVSRDDKVRVSFADSLGFYQTRLARIAWSQPLANKMVAGVAFDEDLSPAA